MVIAAPGAQPRSSPSFLHDVLVFALGEPIQEKLGVKSFLLTNGAKREAKGLRPKACGRGLAACWRFDV